MKTDFITRLKSYNPRARGFFSSPDGRIAVRDNGTYVWFELRPVYGWVECGGTLTKENGIYTPFKAVQS